MMLLFACVFLAILCALIAMRLLPALVLIVFIVWLQAEHPIIAMCLLAVAVILGVARALHAPK